MKKTEAIRELFEETLVDILKGRPVIDKEGNPVTDEEGHVVVARAAAADLAVARAYLKDQAQPQDQNNIPKTGEPTGALAQFLKNKGKNLPFAAGPKTTQ